MARCLNEAGWEARVERDTVGYLFTVDGRTQQNPAFLQDEKTCERELGFDKPLPPLTRTQLEGLYKEHLATRECLEGEAYTIEKPPSLDKFVEMQGRWSAYDSLIDDMANGKLNEGEWNRLNRVCPQPDL
jgi:hypothetical protein